MASAGRFSSADTVAELSRSGVGAFLFVVARRSRYDSHGGKCRRDKDAGNRSFFKTVDIPFIAAERRPDISANSSVFQRVCV